MPPGRLRGAQPAPGRGRSSGCSPTPATPPPARCARMDPADHGQPATCRSSCYQLGARGGGPAGSPATGRRSSGCADAGLPVNDRIERFDRPGGRPRLRCRHARAAPRPRLRDRRGGGEGRRPRPARRARRHQQGAAVGHRLQVPARRRRPPSSSSIFVSHRAHRAGHPVRRARTGLRRRVHRGPGHPAQRGRGGPQGRPRGRHGGRAQGGRRHPRGGGARSSSARPPGAAPWKFPTCCPVCGGPLVRLEGEADTLLRQRSTARPSGCSASSTSPPGGRWTSRGWARSGCIQLVDAGPGVATRPTSTRSTTTTLMRPRAASPTCRPTTCWRPSRRRSPGRWPSCSSAWASATSGRPRRSALAARARPSRPHRRGGRRRSWRRSTASARHRPERARVLRRRAQPGARRQAAGRRGELRGAGAARAGRRDAPGRAHVRAHRHPGRHDPRRGRRPPSKARGGKVAGQRVEEDGLRGRGREPRFQARPRPSPSGFPSSMKTAYAPSSKPERKRQRRNEGDAGWAGGRATRGGQKFW